MKGVQYKGKKLKVDWTPTMAEDLLPQYGMDLEEELREIMQVELNKEIIRELRRMDRVPTVTDRVNPMSVCLHNKKEK